MKSRLTSRTLALLAAASLVTASCSAGAPGEGGTGTDQGGSTAGGGSADTEELSIGFGAEPENLDLTTTAGAALPQVLLYNIYETLVKVDQDGTIVPALAKSWTVSEDRRTYTFVLQEGVTFSNGDEFTAEDVKYSIESVRDDWTISLKEPMDIVESVEVVSPTEVTVTLSEPSNSWLYRMTTRIGAMFSPDATEDLATEPVGTGPYELQKWTRGDSISLSRNAEYWGDEPAFETVNFKYFKDPTALNNALLTGTINVIGLLESPETLGQFEGNDKYQVIEGTTNGEVQLSFNNGSEPMQNEQVRQAVRHAIDHQALLDTCWAGRGTLIGSMVPPTDPWYEDLTGLYPYDVDKASALLEESGHADHTFRLRLPTRSYATSCGTVVQSQLEQAGFNVTIDQLEFPAAWLNTVFTNADYDMTIIAHTEPRDMTKVFGDPGYYTRYDSEEFRDLLQRADSGTEQEEVELLKEAARLLSTDAAADWLFVLPNLIVAEAGITGLPQNAVSESFDVTGLGRS
ncbi:ABC transporter substrate-binding protein [Ornithinimicrobium cavernae]|uniref:ABC transporter substrate-binding protein n=1 Tax=Ornithinimicrobium cavernae TaxID=2666047 RepID=UPI000D68D458|nr:ABC transporter substrate-binding protein [Ornithinimicrobium cavernae]